MSAEIAEALGDCLGSATSMPLLAMGRDIPDGRMRLTREGMLDIDWRIHKSSGYFQRIRDTMEEIADALEGRPAPVHPHCWAHSPLPTLGSSKRMRPHDDDQ